MILLHEECPPARGRPAYPMRDHLTAGLRKSRSASRVRGGAQPPQAPPRGRGQAGTGLLSGSEHLRHVAQQKTHRAVARRPQLTCRRSTPRRRRSRGMTAPRPSPAERHSSGGTDHPAPAWRRHAHRGINVLMLWGAAVDKGYSTPPITRMACSLPRRKLWRRNHACDHSARRAGTSARCAPF